MDNREKRSGMWSVEFGENGEVKKVFWSQAFRELLGFHDITDFPDNLDSWMHRVHPDDKTAVLSAHREMLRGTGYYDVKYRILTRTEGYRWFHDCAELTRGKDNAPSFYMGMLTEMDQGEKYEWVFEEELTFRAALAKAQSDNEKQNDILRALCSDYISIYRVNMDTDKYEIMLLTDALRKTITEIVQADGKYSEILEEYIANYVAAEDVAYVRRKISPENVIRELKNKEKFYIRYHVKDNPEDMKNFEMHFARSKNISDENIVIVGFRNVDALFREKEADRLATQRDIEETLEVARTGLWAIEIEEGCRTRLYADRTMRMLLGVDAGITPEDCHDRWEEGVEPDYLDQAKEAISDMITKGRSEVIYPWNHPRLGRIYIRCGGVRDNTFEKHGYRLKGYHQDITETMVIRKKQEKALLEALIETKKANNAKTEFLSHMSHDIRTPINGILGMLMIGEKNADNLEMQKDCREKIRVSAEHLLSLINDVLDITKLESGAVSFSNEPFSIKNIIDSCCGMMLPQAAESDLRFEMREVSVQHENLIGSPLHLRQILVNIIGNAVKYNKPGGCVSVSVEEIVFTKEIANYRFTISDTGIGMTEEFQEHIFEPFTQEGTDARTYYRGTGLGMSITKKLVEQMGGSISVKSTLNEGSTFCVTLPFKINAEKQETEVQQTEEAVADISGMHVLLVEDNELNSEIAQYLLEDAGATVVKAGNGKEAVDIFAASRPGEFDCILMDIMMPVMDGLEATRVIRHLDREDAGTVPIIALSANAFSEDEHKAKQAGMNSHVAKPLDLHVLFEVMNAYRNK